MQNLIQFLHERLAELRADTNASDHYIQGQIDLIEELLKLLSDAV